MDSMFKLVSLFKDNKDISKIAIALDAAYAIGAIRSKTIYDGTPVSEHELLMMTQDKFKRLGIQESIQNLKG